MGKEKDKDRITRGRQRDEALFPAVASHAHLPKDYGEVLHEIRNRIKQERQKTALAANSLMILLYWDIGQIILQRQDQAGWGAKIIDRLSMDLRETFPDMNGFSPRNLKYMRAFASAWPDREIVQRTVAQFTLAA
jgi:predicted nuclease of restriction endonuclease-like (RecB) superfamily